MSDMEVMAAIGMEHQQHLMDDEGPPIMKSKKSFMQKLTERHEALKLQMRSPKLDDDDQSVAPSRTSSSSSAHKDFFKIATTKSERPIAMRYDDIADDAQPTPVFVKSPVTPSSELESREKAQEQKDVVARTQRQCRRESSVMEMNATHRLYTSYSMSSMGSSCTSPRTAIKFAPPLKARSRSLPSQMTDEQMDAWLDMPEDAEAHRQRKDSVASAQAEYNKRNMLRRKPVARARGSATSPVLFKRDNPFSYDSSEARREIERMFALDTEAKIDESAEHQTLETTKKDAVTFSSLPVEVILEVTRLLDVQSTVRCRQACKKLYETMPAPLQPLASKKT
ncbi:hypothetical protein DE146DRAFT_63393 [Phaeosphaeria sp. MPI-PUGE-AT-0046c]|nr:hypothetical protein DE146DRAFT_63393 [Phaeosphaeria sp. MPI-PUGE-AT-0046c]